MILNSLVKVWHWQWSPLSTAYFLPILYLVSSQATQILSDEENIQKEMLSLVFHAFQKERPYLIKEKCKHFYLKRQENIMEKVETYSHKITDSTRFFIPLQMSSYYYLYFSSTFTLFLQSIKIK